MRRCSTFCPACHQRRTRQTGAWIVASVCHEVPHRQFVFTIPKMLREIFRKRRHLLHLLFQTATECLRDAFRARLGLPAGRRYSTDHTIEFLGRRWPIAPTLLKSITIILHPERQFWVIPHPPLPPTFAWPSVLAHYSL